MKFNFLEKFLNRKSEKNKNQINKKNLYVFPNKKGFQIGILIFFCFSVAIFYQNNFALLLSIILFVIFFISILISYQNLNNLRFKVISNLIPSSENVFLKYQVNNNTNNERININFEQNSKVVNYDIKNSRDLNFENRFNTRGTYEVPKINVNSIFPFGIINTFCKISFNEKVIVYPRPLKPPLDAIKRNNEENEEGFDYEFDKIEENNEEKNLSKISWKHYSIKKKYYHKIFKFNIDSNNLIIDLELLGSNFEKSLSYASYLIIRSYNSKIPFMLKNKEYISEMKCSYDHKINQLTYLANVSN